MTTYEYSAIDRDGQSRTGLVEAPNQVEAIEIVRRLNVFPTNLKKIDRAAFRSKQRAEGKFGRFYLLRILGFQSNALTPSQAAIFSRQLSVMLLAGMRLLPALQLISKRAKVYQVSNCAAEIAIAISSGCMLSEAFRQQGSSFGPLAIGFVKAGEATGQLGEALEQVAQFFEKQVRTKRQIRTALLYPCIVLSVTTIILSGLMIFVVPKFEAIFSDMLHGRPLPWLTSKLLQASYIVRDDGLWIACTMFAVGAMLCFFSQKFFFRNVWDRVKLQLPIVGSIIQKATIARTARTIGTLMGSGVTILEAIGIAQSTAGNAHIARTLEAAKSNLAAGETFSSALAKDKAFPDLAVSLSETGESSGQLAHMLVKIGDVFEQEADEDLRSFISMIEPVMIVLLALVVGTLVIALFLPITAIIEALT